VQALQQCRRWPVANVSAAVVTSEGPVATEGDTDHVYRLASIAKVVTAWATLVAVEEGIVDLDQPVGQPGCTLRHVLAHAGGYAFDGDQPITRPGVRRIYSNTGIEMAADAVQSAAGMPFADYLTEAVLGPLGMSATELRGSPAHALWSSVDDVCRFAAELMAPVLITDDTANAVRTVQFPGLRGVVPGVGSFDECDWGLGAEIRGRKQPHWTGAGNSPDTYGHFGGAGTIVWVDPAVGAALIALTDRPFDEWSADALALWPQLSDAVLDELTGKAPLG
jgi:CubicO group peptidase (beta-lactamase class C family)